MEALVLAALMGLIPAAIARNKGHNFFVWWGFGTALWFIAFPASLFLRKNVDNIAKMDGLVRCPKCAEWVHPAASFCRHCKNAMYN